MKWILDLLEVSIRLVRVKDLVAIHDCNQILCLAEINDVMGIARQHVDALDVVATDLKLYDLICAEFALLNQAMTGHHDEELPLCVVPVLALCDARLTDIDAHLTTIQGMYQFGKRATVIHVHLQWECNLLFWQIAQISTIKFLCK